MIIKAVNESRLLKTIISILLCLTVTAFTMLIKCAEAYAAFPLAMPLIGAGLLLVAGLLVMAGLSFESSNQATLAANQFYLDLKYDFPGEYEIDEEERQAMVNSLLEHDTSGVITVTTAMWELTKSWVNHYYDEGQNNINRDLYTVVDDVGNHIPYCLNHDDRVLLGNTIEWMDNEYEWEYAGTSSIPHVGDVYRYELKKNSEYAGHIHTYIEEKPNFYIFANNEDKLELGAEYKTSETTISRIITNFRSPELSGYEDQIQLARAISNDIEYNIAAIGAVGVVDNPAWDFETEEGERAIYVPTDGTIENYVGITHDDLLTMTNEAVTDIPVPDTDDEDKAWWQDVIGGVSTKVQEVGQLITGTLADIKAWLEGANQSIISAVTTAAASIAEKIQAQEEEDIGPKAKQFKISDLFIIFLDVLMACIRLIIRACVYLATIVQIPPDGSLLNNDTQSGLDLFKNQTIPVINISIWDMYSGLMTLVISLAVVKRVRRTAEK